MGRKWKWVQDSQVTQTQSCSQEVMSRLGFLDQRPPQIHPTVDGVNTSGHLTMLSETMVEAEETIISRPPVRKKRFTQITMNSY